MNLSEIIVEKKTGNEAFKHNNQQLDFNLSDFWSWNQSDLVENRTRGILAEFIVKKALQIESEGRVEWDNFDLITNTGKKIEIKSAAYIQTWEQKKFSNITFGIAETIGAKDSPSFDGLKRRWTDFYVFCLLKHREQNTINPMDLNQWTFYVLETKTLENQLPQQKTIRLNSLLKLNPIECNYSELKNAIDK
ncbi:hypothetical protein LB450_08425 [Psychroflexus sp. CAK1W]|uniref:hypothetical protein n=1 Tax=Psychroflexus curvus TaxID=2873595 RepID=UPI001CCC3182|nr:hypothetical protein [Psychroflexus curvus]MBZ9628121.1 hypothetical protein [Psychroflexus curvus]